MQQQKEFHVLGIKITKDDALIAEWHSEEECRKGKELMRAIYDLICAKL